MAKSSTPPPLAQLRRRYGLSALCFYLARVLLDQGQPCDHTFRHTRAYYAQHAPDVDVEPVLALLRDAGAGCDCEIGHNLCPATGV